jgi:hypothetical protein
MSEMRDLFDDARRTFHEEGIAAAVSMLFADDVVWHTSDSGAGVETLEGSGDIGLRAAMKMATFFSSPGDPPFDFNVDIVDVLTSAEHVALVYEAAAGGDPGWAGRGIVLGRVVDDRIVEAWHQMFDQRGFDEFLAAQGGSSAS